MDAPTLVPVPAPCTVTAATVGDEEVVVWRAASGAVCVMARRCPHLDHDLAAGVIVGEDLVCPGHGWSFTTEGLASKRNEFGRVDPKGRARTWPWRRRGDVVAIYPDGRAG